MEPRLLKEWKSIFSANRYLVLFVFVSMSAIPARAQFPFAFDQTRGTVGTFTAGTAVSTAQLVKIDQTSHLIAPISTSETTGVIGVALSPTTGTGQSIQIGTLGVFTVQVDGLCTAGQFVSISTSGPGQGHCTTPLSTTAQTIGVTVDGGSTTVRVILSATNLARGGSGGTSCVVPGTADSILVDNGTGCSDLTPPTAVNAFYSVGYQVTGNAAVAPIAQLAGVNVDPQTSSYTLTCTPSASTDRLGEVEFNVTTAATLTVPQAGGNGCTQNNYAFVVRNASTSTAVLTVQNQSTGCTGTCSVFNPENVSTKTMLPGSGMFVYSDATTGVGNYHAISIPKSPGGVNVQTGNYTMTALDKDKLVVMNCTASCTLTFPATPPSADWYASGISIGTTTATVSLNSLQLNGSATVPTLNTTNTFHWFTNGTNYFGDVSFGSGGGGTCGGTLTTNYILKWNGSTCTNSSIDDGVTHTSAVTINATNGLYVPAGIFQLGTVTPNCGSTTLIWICPANNTSLGLNFALTETWVVGTGGVAANTLVQMDASNPSKIVAAATGVYGISSATVSAGASVEVARYGTASCVTDTGGATAGHLVVVGTGTFADCKDSGQTSSTLVSNVARIVGVFRSSASAGSTALVELTPSHYGTGNIVTYATAATAAKQSCVSSGATGTCSYIDFPQPMYAPAAVCVSSTPGTGWSTGATPAALCRAGTNNKDALLSPWGTSDVGYFKIHLPTDWDSSASTDISLDLTSTDATSGHTVIMQAATSCAKGDGTTTDDVAFNTAQSFGTITLNGNANRTWTATLTGLTLTGCAAKGIMWIKISRTTDTATNVGVYGATVDVPRLLTVQAN